MLTVKDHINNIKKDGHTKVFYRFTNHGDNAVMEMDQFLSEFESFNVGLNGEFVTTSGETLYNCFIKRTG